MTCSALARSSAWLRVDELAELAISTSCVVAALVRDRPLELPSEQLNSAIEQALVKAELAHRAWKDAFAAYGAEALSNSAVPLPAAVPQADRGLVQHLVSFLPGGSLELDPAEALRIEPDGFISFGLVHGFMLLTDCGARGLYIRSDLGKRRLLEVLPAHQFSLLPYLSLSPLTWRDGQLRAAREFVRRKLNSLAALSPV